jgi:Uncharacterized protein involved in cytokinesis, contains TGc (transglutaminase/protease-like) domain
MSGFSKKVMIISIASLFLILGVFLAYRFFPLSIPISSRNVDPNIRGNSSGNIVNTGFAAKDNEWIYYCDNDGGYKLFKAKLDGTSRTKVCDDYPLYINVSDGWIYYINNSDNERVYKIKADGTKRSKISNDTAEYLTLSGNTLYYSNGSDGWNIYKIDVNGRGRKKIGNESAAYLNLVGDYIYYHSGSHNICKIKTDGTGKVQIAGIWAGYLNVEGDWIYYCDKNDESKLYKVKTDGSQITKLMDRASTCINVKDGWIYYSADACMYRMKTDGTENANLTMEMPSDINIISENVYYRNIYDDDKIYSVKPDGTSRTAAHGKTAVYNIEQLSDAIKNKIDFEITDSKFKEAYDKANQILSSIIKPDMTDFEKEFTIHDYITRNSSYDKRTYEEKLFTSDSHSAYSILTKGIGVCDGYAEAMQLLLNLSGIECRLVIGNEKQTKDGIEAHAWNIVKIDGEFYHLDATWDDNIMNYQYFNASDREMSKDHAWNRDSNPECTSEKYSYLHSLDFASAEDGWIYYSAAGDDHRLNKMKLDGTGKVRLNKYRSVCIQVSNGWVYYSNYSDSGYLYKTKTDGTGTTKLNSDWSIDPNAAGDWIYYTNKDDGDKIYKIRIDGTQRQAAQ